MSKCSLSQSKQKVKVISSTFAPLTTKNSPLTNRENKLCTSSNQKPAYTICLFTFTITTLISITIVISD